MYTDEDLYLAVKAGIFDKAAVDKFRQHIASLSNTQSADEENFRLISGFNDIFVSIAAFIFLVSTGWVFGQLGAEFGFFISAIISWALSVLFVLHKKLALPAILFLAAFVISVVGCLTAMLVDTHFVAKDTGLLIAFGGGTLAAWAHWWQFKVPITVAAGVGTLITTLVILLGVNDFEWAKMHYVICIAGLATFLLAMYWDAQDTARTTRKSDVAFWLHLLAAPMIVHPVFAAQGMLEGKGEPHSVMFVIAVHTVLALVSIAVDRRALMVSALIYVLYAFNTLFNANGLAGSSLAVSGIFIGFILLMLSVFWHKSRVALLGWMPPPLLKYLSAAAG